MSAADHMRGRAGDRAGEEIRDYRDCHLPENPGYWIFVLTNPEASDLITAALAAARHQERERCALWCDVIGKDWEDDRDCRARDAAKYSPTGCETRASDLDPAASREDKQ